MSTFPDDLRADLADAVAQEDMTFGYKKSWQVANDMLRPAESVIAATQTRRVQGRNNDWGVLVVSDRRLLFVHARGFSTATEEIAFTSISGLVQRTRWTHGSIEVTGAGGITTIFDQIKPNRVAPILEAIRSDLARLTSANALEPVTSPADEIKKLADLRDAGILTEEEFSAKKREILGL